MKNRAFYGDIHGCYDELTELYSIVETKYPGIEHYHTGDLGERGPESAKVINFVRLNFAGGVEGNHCSKMKSVYAFFKKKGLKHGNPEKIKMLNQMLNHPNSEDLWRYLEDMPKFRVFDDVGLFLVHGGLYPGVEVWENCQQGVTFLQMTKPGPLVLKSKNRWWGDDAINQPRTNTTEEQSRAEGYLRWYEAYDYEYDCIFGHSVMGLKPFIHQNPGFGKTIGIDTGSCFGGNLTAYIYPDNSYFQVRCKEYVCGKNVKQLRKAEDK